MSDEEKKDPYMVVNSKVKEFCKGGEMRVSSDFYGALNQTIGKIIIKACMHARGEDRGTLRPSDLPEVQVP